MGAVAFSNRIDDTPFLVLNLLIYVGSGEAKDYWICD